LLSPRPRGATGIGSRRPSVRASVVEVVSLLPDS
jgi:hypothetical protein